MRTLTRQETRERAQDLATPLDDLIRPSEVTDGAAEWSEVDRDDLEFEVSESVGIVLSERQDPKLQGLLFDRAMTHIFEGLTRVKMDHLSDDIGRREAVVSHGYQPFKMTEGEAYCHLAEHYQTLRDIPSWAYQDAYDAVSAGLHDGIIPDDAPDL